MKLWNNYLKEMKIAARGFYFYVELFVAVILLCILLVAVKEKSVSKDQEFVYYNMENEVYEFITDKYFEDGSMVLVEPTDFEVKAMEFELTNQDTGEVVAYDFPAGTITATTVEAYDLKTGDLDKTIYNMDSLEDTLRMSYSTGDYGAQLTAGVEDGEFGISYEYYLQGYETDRLENLLYILHNEDSDTVQAQQDAQVVRSLGEVTRLNNRENIVPVFLAFSGSIMGMFIVAAYIFLDKDEGVIKALAVSPSAMSTYLLSKIGVILTNVLISSAIIVIPVMGSKPNYLLVILFLLTSSFLMSSVGLLIASFFDNMTKSFGVLYILMIGLMLPGFSFYIPSFDPVWLRYLPTYSMLQGFKELMLDNADVGYIFTYSGIYIVAGIIVFLLARAKFKSTLTV